MIPADWMSEARSLLLLQDRGTMDHEDGVIAVDEKAPVFLLRVLRGWCFVSFLRSSNSASSWLQNIHHSSLFVAGSDWGRALVCFVRRVVFAPGASSYSGGAMRSYLFN
jgi:hypothetical protein